MQIIGLKNCDTCRKAVKELTAAGHSAVLRDLRETPLNDAEISQFLAEFGADALINRKSTTWRGLDEATRATDPKALLATHATLMKRPVILADNGALYLGWGTDVKAALL